MNERPMLFSAPMVRAILEDRKTKTRRIVKPQPSEQHETADGKSSLMTGAMSTNAAAAFFSYTMGEVETVLNPYGIPRNRLWVRETFADISGQEHRALYRADDDEAGVVITEAKAWKPSIHMPRWASRINLEIVSIQVERLQAITEEDAQAEGAEAVRQIDAGDDCFAYRNGFRQLWDSINGTPKPGKPDVSWAANPWVWVIEFKHL